MAGRVVPEAIAGRFGRGTNGRGRSGKKIATTWICLGAAGNFSSAHAGNVEWPGAARAVTMDPIETARWYRDHWLKK